ncbi:MAG: hypothetical protein EOM34_06650 [Clostridia bacterium]|nr:zinc dependent phospholipase C family protein [Lachnospiraceae bacterium]NCC00344.1 hypothetical protein [Clostridia bacterium]NCD03906.1 hypothetical protein [Clostridia bacterium]
MPGLITNYLFGERAYQSLSPNYLKEVIRKNTNAYRMGLQGPDIFYYYLNSYAKKKKNNICNILHEKNTGAFIDSMLEYASVLDTEDKEICLAYIAGFLCHYALDTHTHPYLHSRMMSDFEENPKLCRDPFYYRRLETMMDTLLLKRLNHMEPSQLNLEALVSVSKRERHQISDCLLYALRSTYHYRLSRKTVVKVLASVRNTCIFLQTNPRMRQRLLCFFENCLKVTPSKTCFIYPEYHGDPHDYLNESKRTWFSESNDTPHTESVFELLNTANIFSNQILEAFDDYLAWHGSLDHLDQVIGSRSYYTGEIC